MAEPTADLAHLFAAARACVQALYGPCRRPVRLRITLDDGEALSLPVPAPWQAPAPQPALRDDDERDCRADILTVLAEAGRRLTTSQILSELAQRQWHHGERTVAGHLADLVEEGALTNDRRARPPGYQIQAAPSPPAG
ncbi:MAG: hypothetical protein L0Z62_34635 [Gemmataceae bacterium]|nr:hypothetical protein [Gemmataceae bacterium]